MTHFLAVQLLILAWIGSEVLVFRRDRQIGQGERKDRFSRAGIFLAITLAIFASFTGAASRWASAPGPWEYWLIAGAALLAFGVLVRVRAVQWLGQYFRTHVIILDDHQLIVDGPYARIRHPAYTGALLCCTGAGVAFANWVAMIALTTLPTVALVYRIKVEERALADRFGAEWQSYRQHTAALLPGVW